MGKNVVLDEDACIGCETCVELAPNTFAFNQSVGKAYVINPDGNSEEEIQEAIDTCPAQCIAWE